MSDPIDPSRPLSSLRRLVRRLNGASVPAQAEVGDNPDRSLPVIIATPVTEHAPPGGAAAAGYTAQVMGQGGQKRGLRGGSETLDRARSTYLETEWSGPSDRRVRRGIITKTEI